MQAPDTEAAEPELFGTETMAELCARQGRLGEAIRIFQRLLTNNPPPEKAARWAERCRSLERARAVAPDLALPEPTRPPPRREARPRAQAQTRAAVAAPPAKPTPPPADESFDLGAEITAVTAPETVRSLDITAVRSMDALAKRSAVEDFATDDGAHDARATPRKTPTHSYLPAYLPADLRGHADGPTAPPAPNPTPAPQEETEPPIEAEAPHRLPLIITQPVRSGQVVYAAKNDLIVLGSVNSGGQVVADGNIHIYGALRGRAIAGAQGAVDARIFCQKLEAELLAISGIYLIYDDIPRAQLGKPAQISLNGDACVVSPL